MRNSRVFALFILAVVSLGSFQGCSKNDYLYYQNPPPPSIKTAAYSLDQTRPSGVDIIWQVGGMTELQQTLITGATSFIKQVVARPTFDWKMGVLSTDPAAQTFLGFTSSYDSTTPSPVQPFIDAVTNVISNFDGEKMMDPVEGALRQFPNFVRKSSELVLIVTNDNHDESDEQVSNFLTFLTQIKGRLDHVIVYAVLGSTDFGCVPDNIDEDWNYVGSTYEQVIQATHGQAYSLCTDDFGTSLSKIFDDIVSQISQPRFYLASRPVVNTIQVMLAGKLIPGGPQASGGQWTYDFNLNAVIFYDSSFAAPATDGEQLKVTYQEDDGLTR